MRDRLAWFKDDNQCFEIPRDQFEKPNKALEEMDMIFNSAEQLINKQINEILEKYQEYKKNKSR
jgi:hypothetical protein